MENKITEQPIYISKEDRLKYVSELQSKHTIMVEEYQRMQTMSSEMEKNYSDLRSKMTAFRKQKDHLRDQIKFLQKMKGCDPIYDLEHLTSVLEDLSVTLLTDKIKWPTNAPHFIDRELIKERLGWFHMPIKCSIATATLYSPKYCYDDFFVIGCVNAASAKIWVKVLEKKLSVFKDQNQSVVIFGEKTGN